MKRNPSLFIILDGCASLGNDIFDTLPSWITSIDDCAFYDCRFTDVNIPQTVASIGKCAFGQSCQPTNDEQAVRGSVYKVNYANVALDYGDVQADWPWAVDGGIGF